MGVFIGFTLAIIIPLFFLGIIHAQDFYQTGQFKLILLSLSGGAIAYALASITNITLEYSGLADRNSIVRFYAPVHEEIFKGLFLLTLVKRRQFSYSVDGALYGFATGVGFAIFENFGYINSNLSEAMTISAQRIFSANLVHASSSAILGIALGIFHLRRTRLRWLVLAAGISFAIGQHMFYNIISHDGNSLVSAFGTGILGGVFIYFVMQLGKKQAQRWIKQKLGMDDRVTRGEVAAVDRLASSGDILMPVYERFGAEKASQVEKLLYLQARLGIKRKALDSFQKDDSLRNAMISEINETRTEMEAVRRTIGVYAMLFVRGLYTEEMVSVWDQMQAKIRERSALNGGQKGGGLWSSLEERVKAQTDAERPE